MLKLSEMFGQRGGSDVFGRRAVKNIGIRTEIGHTFAETAGTYPGFCPGGGHLLSRGPGLRRGPGHPGAFESRIVIVLLYFVGVGSSVQKKTYSACMVLIIASSQMFT